MATRGSAGAWKSGHRKRTGDELWPLGEARAPGNLSTGSAPVTSLQTKSRKLGKNPLCLAAYLGKNQSVSQTIDLIMTIKTSTGSSKTELSSRGKRPFKVRRSGANYGPCPSARKRPALITDPPKFGPTLNIGPAVIMDFKVDPPKT